MRCKRNDLLESLISLFMVDEDKLFDRAQSVLLKSQFADAYKEDFLTHLRACHGDGQAHKKSVEKLKWQLEVANSELREATRELDRRVKGEKNVVETVEVDRIKKLREKDLLSYRQHVKWLEGKLLDKDSDIASLKKDLEEERKTLRRRYARDVDIIPPLSRFKVPEGQRKSPKFTKEDLKTLERHSELVYELVDFLGVPEYQLLHATERLSNRLERAQQLLLKERYEYRDSC
jgi:hypothetical protein